MFHIAFLVAAREYLENLKTRGFWLGILFFPLFWTAAVKVPVLIEKKGVPTRHFVLSDDGGKWGELIEKEINRRHQREVLDDLVRYARRHLKRPADRFDWLEHWNAGPAVDEFIQQGGETGFLHALEGQLEPNAPPFNAPKPRYLRVSFPDGVKESSKNKLVDQLRPWLKGERKVEKDGESVDLFAAILIPPGLGKRSLRQTRHQKDHRRSPASNSGRTTWRMSAWSSWLPIRSAQNFGSRPIKPAGWTRKWCGKSNKSECLW